MAIKYLSPPAKKTINGYDDLGQLGKSDLIDVLVREFDAVLFEVGDEKTVCQGIRDKFAESKMFRTHRVIIFNLTRESSLYASKAFSQLLERITDGSILEGGWGEDFPWVFVWGNRPITYTATTAANGGRILFYKLHSTEFKLVFDRDLAKKVEARACVAASISTITDESSSTGIDRHVIAFDKTFEPSDKGRFEYDDVIDTLITSYPSLFDAYRKHGKKPKTGEEGYVYEKAKFHKFITSLPHSPPIKFSISANIYVYRLKAKVKVAK